MNNEVLIDILYKNRLESDETKESILSELEKKDFMLPDLSGDINYNIWSYCHEIAKFALGVETFKEKFIDALKKQCFTSKSKSLRQRCNALIKYNSNIVFDFFSI